VCADAVLVVDRAEEVVPALEPEAGVDRVVELGEHVVDVVVLGGVDLLVVGSQEGQLVAAVQLDAIEVLEHALLEQQQVDVQGHQQRQHHQRLGADAVVHDFVRNHAERRRVLEHVVPAVLIPADFGHVAQAVLLKLHEVAHHPGDEELRHQPPDWVAAQAALGLRVADFGQLDARKGQHDCGPHALGQLDDFIPHFTRLGLLHLRLLFPQVIRRVYLQQVERQSRQSHRDGPKH